MKEDETIKEKLKDLQFRNKSYFYSASALCENMTNPIDSGVSKGLLDDWDQEVVEMINNIISRLE